MDYDTIAREYQEYGEDALTDVILGYNEVLRVLGDVGGKAILDYGCGSGKFSRLLKQKGAHVSGFDISKVEIDLAKKYKSDISYTDDIDSFNKEEFDIVVLNFVLCTLSSREDMISVLKHVFRVLKHGGCVAILVPNYKEAIGKQFVSFEIDSEETLISGQQVIMVLGTKRQLRVIDYYWTNEDYIQLLQNVGFHVQSITQPKAIDTNHPWLDEKEVSPFVVFSLSKP